MYAFGMLKLDLSEKTLCQRWRRYRRFRPKRLFLNRIPCVWMLSIVQLEGDLQLSRRVCRGRNDPEVRAVDDVGGGRKDCGIRGIECFGPELKLQPLSDWKSPEQGTVQTSVPVGAQRIASQITECIRRRNHEGARVDPPRGCPLFRIRIANQIRPHECVASIRQIALIDDVKGYSGMKRNNGVHLPSAGQMAKHVV